MTAHDPYDECSVCGRWHYTHAEQDHAFQSSERYVTVECTGTTHGREVSRSMAMVRKQALWDAMAVAEDQDAKDKIYALIVCTCHQGIVDPKKPLKCARCGHALRS